MTTPIAPSERPTPFPCSVLNRSSSQLEILELVSPSAMAPPRVPAQDQCIHRYEIIAQYFAPLFGSATAGFDKRVSNAVHLNSTDNTLAQRIFIDHSCRAQRYVCAVFRWPWSQGNLRMLNSMRGGLLKIVKRQERSCWRRAV
ncbi:hypothetical protein PGTUg99_004858 [Puccinia graminis f. sp. tritici]|uniref:Uncharacterized protein n=1 Tax=Puccinia graminis f. sp. tritici TaxID=56615 RepID=A0A5B0PD05_PUCGR|nr:hypothetical protein PGTUg99_004858 [Puccinia graminis f. sp. tritici]